MTLIITRSLFTLVNKHREDRSSVNTTTWIHFLLYLENKQLKFDAIIKFRFFCLMTFFFQLMEHFLCVSFTVPSAIDARVKWTVDKYTLILFLLHYSKNSISWHKTLRWLKINWPHIIPDYFPIFYGIFNFNNWKLSAKSLFLILL